MKVKIELFISQQLLQGDVVEFQKLIDDFKERVLESIAPEFDKLEDAVQHKILTAIQTASFYRLNLKNCRFKCITPQLSLLDLERCENFEVEALVNGLQSCLQLQKLHIAGCERVT